MAPGAGARNGTASAQTRCPAGAVGSPAAAAVLRGAAVRGAAFAAAARFVGAARAVAFFVGVAFLAGAAFFAGVAFFAAAAFFAGVAARAVVVREELVERRRRPGTGSPGVERPVAATVGGATDDPRQRHRVCGV
ncbi:hypothetical protein GCM10028783_20830 [Modestobacter muralis]